jgi:hypothetical protein
MKFTVKKHIYYLQVTNMLAPCFSHGKVRQVFNLHVHMSINDLDLKKLKTGNRHARTFIQTLQ